MIVEKAKLQPPNIYLAHHQQQAEQQHEHQRLLRATAAASSTMRGVENASREQREELPNEDNDEDEALMMKDDDEDENDEENIVIDLADEDEEDEATAIANLQQQQQQHLNQEQLDSLMIRTSRSNSYNNEHNPSNGHYVSAYTTNKPTRTTTDNLSSTAYNVGQQLTNGSSNNESINNNNQHNDATAVGFNVGDSVWFDPNQYGYYIPGKVTDIYEADMRIFTIEGYSQPAPLSLSVGENLLNTTHCGASDQEVESTVATTTTTTFEQYNKLLLDSEQGELQLYELSDISDAFRTVKMRLPLSEECGLNDLIDLDELNLESILWNLKLRYKQELVYSNCGQKILISVNPFNQLCDLYNLEQVSKYNSLTNSNQLRSLNISCCRCCQPSATGSITNTTINNGPHDHLVDKVAGAHLHHSCSSGLIRWLLLHDNIVAPSMKSDTFTNHIKQSSELKRRTQNEPHIFSMANEALKKLLITGQDQCFVLLGESGSGKTEACKLLVQYFATVNKSPTNLMTEQILESIQVLESFGNAKTVHNVNSSRFGKLLDIRFNLNNGFILNAKTIDLNLLDRSRIVSQTEGERNYHIFYELLAGLSAKEKEKYGLQTAEKYFYLNQGHCVELESKDDGDDFRSLLASMQVLGFNYEEQDTIFRLLASVLHLGNIYFHRKVLAVRSGKLAAANNKLDHNHQQAAAAANSLGGAAGVEGVEIGSDTEVRWVSHLLQIQFDLVMRCLSTRTIEASTTVHQAPGEQAQVLVDKIVTPLNIDQALDTRDAIARTLYNCLFKWLVQRINVMINQTNTTTGSIDDNDQAQANYNLMNSQSATATGGSMGADENPFGNLHQEPIYLCARTSESLCEFQPDKLQQAGGGGSSSSRHSTISRPTKTSSSSSQHHQRGGKRKKHSHKHQHHHHDQQQQQHQALTSATITILDAFGFENLYENNFEQLCINYTAELLHYHTTRYLIRLEQVEYAKERLKWINISGQSSSGGSFGHSSSIGHQMAAHSALNCSTLSSTTSSGGAATGGGGGGGASAGKNHSPDAIVNLISKKPRGILALLDDECNFPKASDQSFMEKCHHNHAGDENYQRARLEAASNQEFGIRHFKQNSRLVWYQVEGFIEKNLDTLRPDIVELLVGSKMAIVGDMLRKLHQAQEYSQSSMSKKTLTRTYDGRYVSMKPRTTTVAARFQDALHNNRVLDSLNSSLSSKLMPSSIVSGPTTPNEMNNHYSLGLNGRTFVGAGGTGREMECSAMMLMKPNPWFVICLKPNRSKTARVFDVAYVQDQMRTLNLVEITQIRKRGFPHRLRYIEFLRHYKCLQQQMSHHPHHHHTTNQKFLTSDDLREKCVSILEFALTTTKQQQHQQQVELFQCGLTKIFLNEKLYHQLEMLRLYAYKRAILMLQKTFRMLPVRRDFLDKRYATIVIQTQWRGFLARREFWRQYMLIVFLQQKWRQHLMSKRRKQLEAKRLAQRQRQQQLLLEAQAKQRALSNELRFRIQPTTTTTNMNSSSSLSSSPYHQPVSRLNLDIPEDLAQLYRLQRNWIPVHDLSNVNDELKLDEMFERERRRRRRRANYNNGHENNDFTSVPFIVLNDDYEQAGRQQQQQQQLQATCQDKQVELVIQEFELNESYSLQQMLTKYLTIEVPQFGYSRLPITRPFSWHQLTRLRHSYVKRNVHRLRRHLKAAQLDNQQNEQQISAAIGQQKFDINRRFNVVELKALAIYKLILRYIDSNDDLDHHQQQQKQINSSSNKSHSNNQYQLGEMQRLVKFKLISDYIIYLCLTEPLLRDELYLQLMSQSWQNSNSRSCEKVWKLMVNCLNCFVPLDVELRRFLLKYVSDYCCEKYRLLALKRIAIALISADNNNKCSPAYASAEAREFPPSILEYWSNERGIAHLTLPATCYMDDHSLTGGGEKQLNQQQQQENDESFITADELSAITNYSNKTLVQIEPRTSAEELVASALRARQVPERNLFGWSVEIQHEGALSEQSCRLRGDNQLLDHFSKIELLPEFKQLIEASTGECESEMWLAAAEEEEHEQEQQKQQQQNYFPHQQPQLQRCQPNQYHAPLPVDFQHYDNNEQLREQQPSRVNLRRKLSLTELSTASPSMMTPHNTNRFSVQSTDYTPSLVNVGAGLNSQRHSYQSTSSIQQQQQYELQGGVGRRQLERSVSSRLSQTSKLNRRYLTSNLANTRNLNPQQDHQLHSSETGQQQYHYQESEVGFRGGGFASNYSTAYQPSSYHSNQMGQMMGSSRLNRRSMSMQDIQQNLQGHYFNSPPPPLPANHYHQQQQPVSMTGNHYASSYVQQQQQQQHKQYHQQKHYQPNQLSSRSPLHNVNGSLQQLPAATPTYAIRQQPQQHMMQRRRSQTPNSTLMSSMSTSSTLTQMAPATHRLSSSTSAYGSDSHHSSGAYAAFTSSNDAPINDHHAHQNAPPARLSRRELLENAQQQLPRTMTGGGARGSAQRSASSSSRLPRGLIGGDYERVGRRADDFHLRDGYATPTSSSTSSHHYQQQQQQQQQQWTKNVPGNRAMYRTSPTQQRRRPTASGNSKQTQNQEHGQQPKMKHRLKPPPPEPQLHSDIVDYDQPILQQQQQQHQMMMSAGSTNMPATTNAYASAGHYVTNSSAMSDTSEAPSLASHVRRIKVPPNNTSGEVLDQYLDDLFNPMLDDAELDELSDARSLATSIRGLKGDGDDETKQVAAAAAAAGDHDDDELEDETCDADGQMNMDTLSPTFESLLKSLKSDPNILAASMAVDTTLSTSQPTTNNGDEGELTTTTTSVPSEPIMSQLGKLNLSELKALNEKLEQEIEAAQQSRSGSLLGLVPTTGGGHGIAPGSASMIPVPPPEPNFGHATAGVVGGGASRLSSGSMISQSAAGVGTSELEDIYSRAKTVRIGKWRWPPAREDQSLAGEAGASAHAQSNESGCELQQQRQQQEEEEGAGAGRTSADISRATEQQIRSYFQHKENKRRHSQQQHMSSTTSTSVQLLTSEEPARSQPSGNMVAEVPPPVDKLVQVAAAPAAQVAAAALGGNVGKLKISSEMKAKLESLTNTGTSSAVRVPQEEGGCSPSAGSGVAAQASGGAGGGSLVSQIKSLLVAKQQVAGSGAEKVAQTGGGSSAESGSSTTSSNRTSIESNTGIGGGRIGLSKIIAMKQQLAQAADANGTVSNGSNLAPDATSSSVGGAVEEERNRRTSTCSTASSSSRAFFQARAQDELGPQSRAAINQREAFYKFKNLSHPIISSSSEGDSPNAVQSALSTSSGKLPTTSPPRQENESEIIPAPNAPVAKTSASSSGEAESNLVEANRAPLLQQQQQQANLSDDAASELSATGHLIAPSIAKSLSQRQQESLKRHSAATRANAATLSSESRDETRQSSKINTTDSASAQQVPPTSLAATDNNNTNQWVTSESPNQTLEYKTSNGKPPPSPTNEQDKEKPNNRSATSNKSHGSNRQLLSSLRQKSSKRESDQQQQRHLVSSMSEAKNTRSQAQDPAKRRSSLVAVEQQQQKMLLQNKKRRVDAGDGSEMASLSHKKLVEQQQHRLEVSTCAAQYANIDWQIKIRKEFFLPSETYDDPLVVQLIFAQLVADVFNPMARHWTSRLNNKERAAIKSLMKDNSIGYSSSLPKINEMFQVKRELIRMARSFGLYFTRSYPAQNFALIYSDPNHNFGLLPATSEFLSSVGWRRPHSNGDDHEGFSLNSTMLSSSSEDEDQERDHSCEGEKEPKKNNNEEETKQKRRVDDEAIKLMLRLHHANNLGTQWIDLVAVHHSGLRLVELYGGVPAAGDSSLAAAGNKDQQQQQQQGYRVLETLMFRDMTNVSQVGASELLISMRNGKKCWLISSNQVGQLTELLSYFHADYYNDHHQQQQQLSTSGSGGRRTNKSNKSNQQQHQQVTGSLSTNNCSISGRHIRADSGEQITNVTQAIGVGKSISSRNNNNNNNNNKDALLAADDGDHDDHFKQRQTTSGVGKRNKKTSANNDLANNQRILPNHLASDSKKASNKQHQLNKQSAYIQSTNKSNQLSTNNNIELYSEQQQELTSDDQRQQQRSPTSSIYEQQQQSSSSPAGQIESEQEVNYQQQQSGANKLEADSGSCKNNKKNSLWQNSLSRMSSKFNIFSSTTQSRASSANNNNNSHTPKSKKSLEDQEKENQKTRKSASSRSTKTKSSSSSPSNTLKKQQLDSSLMMSNNSNRNSTRDQVTLDAWIETKVDFDDDENEISGAEPAAHSFSATTTTSSANNPDAAANHKTSSLLSPKSMPVTPTVGGGGSSSQQDNNNNNDEPQQGKESKKVAPSSGEIGKEMGPTTNGSNSLGNKTAGSSSSRSSSNGGSSDEADGKYSLLQFALYNFREAIDKYSLESRASKVKGAADGSGHNQSNNGSGAGDTSTLRGSLKLIESLRSGKSTGSVAPPAEESSSSPYGSTNNNGKVEQRSKSRISGKLRPSSGAQNSIQNHQASSVSSSGDWTWRELAEMVKFTRMPIKHSLLKLNNDELDRRAVECFAAIMQYMGDLAAALNHQNNGFQSGSAQAIGGGGSSRTSSSKHSKHDGQIYSHTGVSSALLQADEEACVYLILSNCHNYAQLRDEVYCQLMKQTTNNRSDQPDSCLRGWRLFSMVAAYFDCSPTFKPYLVKYLESAAYDKQRAYYSVAALCLQNLRKTFKYGGRKNVPSIEEIAATSAGRNSKRQIYRLPGGTERVINTKSTTVVDDIIHEICSNMLNVTTPDEMLEFSLYCIADGDLYTMPLNGDEYILDITTELIKNHQQYFLIFCRSIWHYPLRLDSKLYIEVIFNQIAPDYIEGLLLVLPTSGLSSSSSSRNNNNNKSSSSHRNNTHQHPLRLKSKLVREIARLAALLHRASGTDYMPHKDEIKYLLPKPIISAMRQHQRTLQGARVATGALVGVGHGDEVNNNNNDSQQQASRESALEVINSDQLDPNEMSPSSTPAVGVDSSELLSSPGGNNSSSISSSRRSITDNNNVGGGEQADKLKSESASAAVQMTTPQQWIELVQANWRDMSAFDTLDAKAQFLDIVRHWPLFGSSFFAIKLIQRDLIKPMDFILALNKLGIQMLDLLSHETIHRYPFNEVISTRKVRSEDGALFLDLKCGNLMRRTIIRIQTDQAHEISRLIRQYIDIELLQQQKQQQQQHQQKSSTTTNTADY